MIQNQQLETVPVEPVYYESVYRAGFRFVGKSTRPVACLQKKDGVPRNTCGRIRGRISDRIVNFVFRIHGLSKVYVR
jgi:hypothetical protein